MKIGIDISILCRKKTGVGYYTENVIKSLLAIDKTNNYKFFWMSLPGSSAKLPLAFRTVRPRHFPLSYKLLTYSWAGIKFPPADFFYKDVDMIHSIDMASLPFSKKQKITGTIYDITPELFPSLHTRRNIYLHKKRITFLRTYAHRVITISETSKSDIIRHYNIPPEKITVALPGVNTELYRKIERDSVQRVLRQYQVPNNYILYVGTLEPRKNIEGLIGALKILVNQYNFKGQLVLTGKRGWKYKSIFEMIQRWNLNDRIIFTNYIPQADLPMLMNGASCFVYPSFYEGFGLPVIEAMACGTPVVTSNTASLSEAAGDAACLVDPHSPKSIAEGLNKVISQRQFRDELANKGLKRARNFSWEKTAEKHIEAYEQVQTAP